MRFVFPAAAMALSWLACQSIAAEPALTAPNVTVGRNLQTYAAVTLAQVVAAPGLQVTLTSADPERLLLSKASDQPGAASITVTVMPHFRVSTEFWVQGRADSGTVTYSATAPGVGTATGTVTLAPSAIVIAGPFRLPSFPGTPKGYPAKLSVFSAMLDSSHKVAEEQQVAGGSQVEVSITNSNPEVGAVGAPKLTFTGGTSEATTYFKPAAQGNTTLGLVPPPGFTKPAALASVIAAIDLPGVAITDDVILGKNLQTPGVLCLGETPPAGGTQVTLTSSDPSKLVLSKRPDESGSGAITLSVPEGQLTAKYYLQSLADSGVVTYKATAPDFRSRVARIGLAPSGVIVAYERYGPPDEASVLRAGAANDERRFYASLTEAKKQAPHVVVWSVRLDPATGLAADITVQELRPGVSAAVTLASSNPEVGTVESPLTIASGSNHAVSKFIPLSKGETVISVNTPAGFARPKNAISVPATVVD